VADTQDAIEAFLADTGVPGATVAVIAPVNGTLNEFTFSAGLSDVTADVAADPAHYYRFASITKPMTSVVVLQLVAEGLIDLDATVASYLGDDWIPSYELDGVDYAADVTIRQILNHTDGFAEYAFDPGFYIMVSSRLDQEMAPQEIIDWASGVGPLYAPGTDYAYNTVGHVVAGLVIEAVTGRDALDVMTEQLFTPADATDVYLPPGTYPPDDLVAGHVAGELKAAIDLLPGFQPYREDSVVGDFYDVTVAPQAVTRTAGWTGGGLEAQADDVARIFRSFFHGALGDAELSEFVTTSDYSNYGLGISVGEWEGEPRYSHGGGVPGFRSDATHLPDSDITIALSTNLIPYEPDVSSLTDAILDVIAAELIGA